MDKLKLYQSENLDALRNEGDPLADAAVLDLYSNPAFAERINTFTKMPTRDELVEFPASVQKYFQSFTVQVDFLELGKIKLAQEYFDQNGQYYLSMLGFYSLPYCYAFADGAQVLVRSKRITDEIGKRLSETALFLLDCFRPGSFISDERALLSIAKVRLIHAFSRFFIQKYTQDWTKEWGIPINQEDMLGTNLAFSLLVMRGMEKLRKFPGKEVLEAVLHYWKVIGYHMGIDVEFWPENAKEAFELEKLIRRRHLKESDAGKLLTRSLLRFYQSEIPDTNLADLAETMVAFFVGKEAAEALDLKEKVTLPKDAFRFLLKFNFWKEGNAKVNYGKIRREFLSQQRVKFGHEIALSVPTLKRS
ncbi:oxygenase MpaB family protein [Mongoliibacter ruber]|uniref:Uncharacterized protein DUF2236 n=1 Tax=Mongoliibacter ruber TaxID=1750599 RepID=A0A2T0WDS4_9BACT|nr:oxygenase MpaB family protein [Mongoliibacter ruber]PRY84863.1 uncharacterized protein DUF2236 [Mongoliibacter ruber]